MGDVLLVIIILAVVALVLGRTPWSRSPRDPRLIAIVVGVTGLVLALATSEWLFLIALVVAIAIVASSRSRTRARRR